jgi:hypothetical protein
MRSSKATATKLARKPGVAVDVESYAPAGLHEPLRVLLLEQAQPLEERAPHRIRMSRAPRSTRSGSSGASSAPALTPRLTRTPMRSSRRT